MHLKLTERFSDTGAKFIPVEQALIKETYTLSPGQHAFCISTLNKDGRKSVAALNGNEDVSTIFLAESEAIALTAQLVDLPAEQIMSKIAEARENGQDIVDLTDHTGYKAYEKYGAVSPERKSCLEWLFG